MADRGGFRGGFGGGDRGGRGGRGSAANFYYFVESCFYRRRTSFAGGRGGGDRGGRGRGGRGRGRGGGRGKEGGKDEWVPVTKLGRLVKDGKIKTLEEIYLNSLPIKVRY